jgi:hypothetical protein
LSALRGAGRPAEVGVDDLDVLRCPAALEGPLPESLLKTTALLMREDLMRVGLTDIDQGLAGEMELGNMFADAHG